MADVVAGQYLLPRSSKSCAKFEAAKDSRDRGSLDVVTLFWSVALETFDSGTRSTEFESFSDTGYERSFLRVDFLGRVPMVSRSSMFALPRLSVGDKFCDGCMTQTWSGFNGDDDSVEFQRERGKDDLEISQWLQPGPFFLLFILQVVC